MKLAFLTTDNREPHRRYDLEVPYFGTAPEALLQGFAGMPDLEVHVISCTQQPMKSPAKLAENIYFHSLHVPKLGWMRTLYQGCVRATRRKLREINPDIVHGQGTERECALSGVLSGFPSVLTIHGNMRVMAKLDQARPLTFYWLAARLESFTLPRAEGIVCITNYTRNEVQALNSRTWIIPNAVDASFFEIANAPSENPILLCVGNISPRKNQNAFIQALDGLAVGRTFRVVFLGSISPNDSYGEVFTKLIAKRPWCEYAGFADRPTLKSWLAKAAALILPSLEDNCPMVVLEAMAAGVPVAAARVGGVPDLIDPGVTGLLFAPESKEIHSAVALLLDRHFTNSTTGPAARQEAWSRFHPQAIARRHCEIYREILTGA